MNTLKMYKTGLAGLVIITGMSFYGNSIADETESTKGDFTRGAKSWSDNCTRCHNVRDPKELRDDQWITTTYHMRVRAGLTGQETRDIIEFLQKSN